MSTASLVAGASGGSASTLCIVSPLDTLAAPSRLSDASGVSDYAFRVICVLCPFARLPEIRASRSFCSTTYRGHPGHSPSPFPRSSPPGTSLPVRCPLDPRIAAIFGEKLNYQPSFRRTRKQEKESGRPPRGLPAVVSRLSPNRSRHPHCPPRRIFFRALIPTADLLPTAIRPGGTPTTSRALIL